MRYHFISIVLCVLSAGFLSRKYLASTAVNRITGVFAVVSGVFAFKELLDIVVHLYERLGFAWFVATALSAAFGAAWFVGRFVDKRPIGIADVVAATLKRIKGQERLTPAETPRDLGRPVRVTDEIADFREELTSVLSNDEAWRELVEIAIPKHSGTKASLSYLKKPTVTAEEFHAAQLADVAAWLRESEQALKNLQASSMGAGREDLLSEVKKGNQRMTKRKALAKAA